MISLIDCNNFYVSCERAFDASLKGKAVIVLSNNDGCAISRSEEAKALGIKMGTPEFMIREMIKQHDIRIFSSNYTLYGDMSRRVMQVIREFVPKTEIYSIDEIFCDLSSLKYVNLEGLAHQIRETVVRCTGIPVSVGIGKTKTLAKMANRYAKKQHREEGVYCADTKEKEEAMLHFTDVGDVWGIGRQYGLKLKTHGFHTAADFIEAPPDWVRKEMNVVGLRTQRELSGIVCIKWEDVAPAKKNICNSHSFGRLVTQKRELQQAVATYTANCAQTLRKEGTFATRLHVFIQTNVHRREDAQYLRSITMDITVPTSHTQELLKYAMTALNILFKPGFNYHKAGVMALDLVPATQTQMSLFDTADRERDTAVMQAMDGVNKSFGRDVVRLATQEFTKEWKLRQQFISKCYTTRFDHLATVKAK